MERREAIIGGLDLAGCTGLELGPLSKPLVAKTDGDVLYVDHADADALKTQYRGSRDYDVNRFVDVDVVWTGSSFVEALGRRTVDYVVASHVIEHVPDLVGWLTELRAVLKAEGSIRLAVPDKRFTFDRFRPCSKLSEILSAWIRCEPVPSTQAILEYRSCARPVDHLAIWSGDQAEPPDLATSDNAWQTLDAATLRQALLFAKRAQRDGEYQDAHCWIFTPRSFCRVMEALTGLKLIDLACTKFIGTQPDTNEFFAHLAPAEEMEATATWRRAAEQADAFETRRRAGTAEADLAPVALQPLGRPFGDLALAAHTFGSDKVPNCSAYESYLGPLRHTQVNVFEISDRGCDDRATSSASLRMWAAFFPHGTIHMLDPHGQADQADARTRIYRGREDDTALLAAIAAEIEPLHVVIDDGGHISEQVIASFETLFPRLAPGGIYIIEDVGTSYWTSHGGSADLDAPHTSLNYFKRLVDSLNRAALPQPALFPAAAAYVDFVHFYENFIVLKKKA